MLSACFSAMAGLRIAESDRNPPSGGGNLQKPQYLLWAKGDLHTGFRRLEDLGAIVEVKDEGQRYKDLGA